MKTLLPFCIRALILFLMPLSALAKETVINGEFDFSKNGEAETALYGDWLFFPGELIEPATFLERINSSEQLKTVPIMTSYAKAAPEVLGDETGYATYAVKLVNIPTNTTIGMLLSDLYGIENLYSKPRKAKQLQNNRADG